MRIMKWKGLIEQLKPPQKFQYQRIWEGIKKKRIYPINFVTSLESIKSPKKQDGLSFGLKNILLPSLGVWKGFRQFKILKRGKVIGGISFKKLEFGTSRINQPKCMNFIIICLQKISDFINSVNQNGLKVSI